MQDIIVWASPFVAAALLWFIIRYINKNDENQQKLENKFDKKIQIIELNIETNLKDFKQQLDKSENILDKNKVFLIDYSKSLREEVSNHKEMLHTFIQDFKYDTKELSNELKNLNKAFKTLTPILNKLDERSKMNSSNILKLNDAVTDIDNQFGNIKKIVHTHNKFIVKRIKTDED